MIAKLEMMYMMLDVHVRHTVRPSISDSSCAMTRDSTPPPDSPRGGARPSISSKNTMAGAARRALQRPRHCQLWRVGLRT